MLRSLHIRDFVIVDRMDIGFDAGFTVFSGETGAGKSILIDALALALGERADSGVVRVGTERADISAVFDLPSPLRSWLQEQALDSDDELVLRRVVDRQGRGRGFINGVPATLAQLRQVGARLVDIHGQHAHQSLLRADAQRDLLDTHGGHTALVTEVSAAWRQWRELEHALQRADQAADALAQAREQLQWQAEALERLGLHADEWQHLTHEQERLAHAQTLIDGVAQCTGALDGNDDSITDRLNAVCNQIGGLRRYDASLAEIYDALDGARITIVEAVSDLNGYLSRLDLDPERLSVVEDRLSAIFETARRLKSAPELLYARRATVISQLAELERHSDIEGLRAQTKAAQATYETAAASLSTARKKTLKPLAKQVTRAMQDLAMTGGRFDIALTTAPASAHGTEYIEFLAAGHAGVSPRPLGKVVSGGELSRIALALSVIASQAACLPTLIFDEVDSGVGGAIAEVVGRLLRELGQRHQVLCVTHLPQVAACGAQHFRVTKQETKGQTRSNVMPLDVNARVEEIARMLGGINITSTTRDHAREMLA
jgi:DNA repair protein RecN (Recombination protein N)